MGLSTQQRDTEDCFACRKGKAAKRLVAVEAERDALKTELLGQKQEAAEQLAAANTARDAAAAELAAASKQLQAAQADVQRLQGRVSELETAEEQTRGAHSAASKYMSAAQVVSQLSQSMKMTCLDASAHHLHGAARCAAWKFPFGLVPCDSRKFSQPDA